MDHGSTPRACRAKNSFRNKNRTACSLHVLLIELFVRFLYRMAFPLIAAQSDGMSVSTVLSLGTSTKSTRTQRSGQRIATQRPHCRSLARSDRSVAVEEGPDLDTARDFWEACESQTSDHHWIALVTRDCATLGQTATLAHALAYCASREAAGAADASDLMSVSAAAHQRTARSGFAAHFLRTTAAFTKSGTPKAVRESGTHVDSFPAATARAAKKDIP